MENPICIICNEGGGDVTTIKTKAIHTLIDSSKKRRDRKYVKWSNLTSACVHRVCSNRYNRDTSIDTVAAEHCRRTVEGKEIIKSSHNFDFKNLCLICGEVFHESKEKVKGVKKNETGENIIKLLTERKSVDKFSKTLVARLSNNKNLVELEARYHASCMSNMYGKRLSDHIGRPPTQNTVDFVHHAIEFIKNNGSESQFSLNEIKDSFTGSLPDLQTIKSKLSKAYCQNEIQFINTGTDIIILFRHKMSKDVWKEWYANQSKDPKLEKSRIIKMAGQIILEDIRAKVHDTDNYILPNFNDNNYFENIPDSLVEFLDIIIKSHKNKKKRIMISGIKELLQFPIA